MSQLYVDNIRNRTGGPIGIPTGAVVTGVITATSFAGDGSGLTGVASTDNIVTGTAATFNNLVNVGTNIKLDATSGIVTATGVNVTGIVTATSFVGSGASLTGISSWEVFDTWLYGGG